MLVTSSCFSQWLVGESLGWGLSDKFPTALVELQKICLCPNPWNLCAQHILQLINKCRKNKSKTTPDSSLGRILRFSHPQPMFSNHADRRLLNVLYKALRASCLFGGFRALQLACCHLSGALGGPSWHSSTRDLETRNRVEDAPWDIQALPSASP